VSILIERYLHHSSGLWHRHDRSSTTSSGRKICQDDVVNVESPFAVVIVTFDHAETLPLCLAAVERLDPTPTRLVVVDNASTDASVEIASARSGNLDVQVLCEGQNTGFAAAANRGIAATSEPWVLLLNPDCAPKPDFVRHLFEAVASSAHATRIGAVSPKLLRAEGPNLEPGTTIDAAGMVVTPSGRHHDRGAGFADDGSFDRSAWVFGGTGAAILLRREALIDVAYPDEEIFAESFFAYREDAELAWRLQLRGWRCLYAPKAVAAHQRGFRPEKGRSGHETINRYSVRNRFLLRRHCADLRWNLRFFPWWFVRDLMVIGACLTVERPSLPALADVWRLRAESRRRRSWVLGRRTVPPRQINRWFRRRGRVEEVEGP
jgi:GT2 family glycosyltransferase